MRFTEEDYDAIVLEAEMRKMTVSDFIRMRTRPVGFMWNTTNTSGAEITWVKQPSM